MDSSLFTFHFSLLCDVHATFTILLRLQHGSLHHATRRWAKDSIVDKILQFAVRGEDNVNLLDVGGGEFVQRFCTLAADGETKGAQALELHLVAVQQLLAHTAGHVGKHALDSALREHAVVSRDMHNLSKSNGK